MTVDDLSWRAGGWRMVNRATLVVCGGRVAVLFAASAMLIALAACSSDTTTNPAGDTSTPAEPLPDSAAPTSTVSAVDSAKQDALAAYRGMWQDFIKAGRTSDWQSPELGRHATGVALQNLARGLYTDHQNGVVTKGQPALDPQVSSVEPATKPTKIVITDCGDSTNFLKYDAESGQLADSEPGGRQLINGIVDLQSDGSWKVSDFGIHEVGSC